MTWEVVLEKIKPRGFSPLTASKKKLGRKKELRGRLASEIRDKELSKIQTRTKNKPLFLDVCFYILESDKLGKSKRDLDNLLKILFDVLSENMVNGQLPIAGLGIMKNDSYVYKIKCEKRLVDSEEKQGIDLLISRQV